MAANSSVAFYRPRELSPEVVHSVLGLVGVRINPSEIEKWTELELLLAYDYAMRSHLRASDNPTRLRPEPHFVAVASTSPDSPIAD